MNLFGWQISRAKKKTLSPPSGRWWPFSFDVVPGFWQQDAQIETDTALTFSAVYACIRLISSDIGKLRLKLVSLEPPGIWQERTSAAFSPVLRKPNSTQTRIKFYEQWIISKLVYGNTYVLKRRDARGVVVEMNVLDPTRVTPLVSQRGEVFYQVRTDNVAGIEVDVTLPATEIIHDVHVTPENALVGVGPIVACGLATSQGLAIQNNSHKFFSNMSRPSGMLSAPGSIGDDTATRLKTSFEANFGGENIGRLLVAGDGLEFKGFSMPAEDAQLIEQLNWTALDVCRAFGVPAYKIGVGPMPAYNNIESLERSYYSQTLQELIECIELLLDEGLELPTDYGTEFDLGGLLRMDSKTQAEVDELEMRAGIISPNEARAKRDLLPVEGGDSPMAQQQNYSLAALAKRDAKEDPFATTPTLPKPPPEEPKNVEASFIELLTREVA